MISLHHHGAPAAQILLRRLQRLTSSPLDAAFAGLQLDGDRRRLAAGDLLMQADGPPGEARILISGVAGDQRILPDGRRQILALRLPGDVVMAESRESVAALTDVETVDAKPLIRLLTERAPEHPALRRAWIASARAEHAMQRDHVIRLGRLSAVERLAHVLMETHDRLLQVGLANACAFHMPVRQDMMADLLGLSVVHLSRVTQQLRRERLVEIRSNYVSLLNRDGLQTLGSYVSRFPTSVVKTTRSSANLEDILEPRYATLP